MGFEPTTSGTTIQRSNQLSYGRQRKKTFSSKNGFLSNKSKSIEILMLFPYSIIQVYTHKHGHREI